MAILGRRDPAEQGFDLKTLGVGVGQRLLATAWPSPCWSASPSQFRKGLADLTFDGDFATVQGLLVVLTPVTISVGMGVVGATGFVAAAGTKLLLGHECK